MKYNYLVIQPNIYPNHDRIVGAYKTKKDALRHANDFINCCNSHECTETGLVLEHAIINDDGSLEFTSEPITYDEIGSEINEKRKTRNAD